MWVRGLKLAFLRKKCMMKLSHPMWVRGLKHTIARFVPMTEVAPYVGAWIETSIL